MRKASSKRVMGISGHKSVLCNAFVKEFKNKYIYKFYKGRIESKKKFNIWLVRNNKINFFINFAAITSVSECEKNKKRALNINYKANINIVNCLNQSYLKNFKYFLFISSSHVYKPSFKLLNEKSQRVPSNYYGLTKKKFEDYIEIFKKKFNFNIGVARVFNFYSPRKTKGFFINDIISKSRKNKVIKLGSINTYRDYTDTADIVRALDLMISKKLSSAFNICSGIKYNLLDIVLKIIKSKKIYLEYEKNYKEGIFGNNKKIINHGWRITGKKLYDLI